MEDNVNRPYEDDDTFHYVVRYEMNLNETRIERVIYGVFDWLGDCGGFHEAITWVALAFLMFTSFMPLQNLMVSKLFLFESLRD